MSNRAGVPYPGLGADQERHHDCILECFHPGLCLVDQQCVLFGFEACLVDIDAAAIGMDECVPALPLRQSNFGTACKMGIVQAHVVANERWSLGVLRTSE